MKPLNIDPADYRYSAMIGVGGIGAGSFFSLNGDHTLGREESRLGCFLDRQDYCKLHIISHYVGTLLGPKFATIPVGKVGDDDVGGRLYAEMEEAGLAMGRVRTSPGDSTLFSFCFIYPDGSGGNMTTDDSVCSKVDPAFVAEAEPEFARFDGKGIALAAPEVPLEARRELLRLATKYKFFRAASFNSEEMKVALDTGLLSDVDLLAINLDEAAIAAGRGSTDDQSPEMIVRDAIKKLNEVKPELLVSITAGARGSWAWDGETLSHTPVFTSELRSSAGAGDAHLSGVIAGLVAGLTLTEASQLGALVAGMSVTSPHTLDKRINRDSLRKFAERLDLYNSVRQLLEE